MPEQRVIDNTDHVAVHPWPDGMFVQGGGHGVVFSTEHGTYRTAFVEAFPETPPTFLRGEGETLAEAEDVCWAKYVRYRDCPHGAYDRAGYRNGSGICMKCGTWINGVFDPLPSEPSPHRGLMDRVFRDGDLGAAAELLDAVVNADQLPTKSALEGEADHG